MMMKCKLKWVADKKGGEGVQCLETYSFQCLYLAPLVCCNTLQTLLSRDSRLFEIIYTGENHFKL